MINSIHKNLAGVLLFLFLGITLNGQDTLALDMKGLLAYCKANNNTMKVYAAQMNIEQLKKDQLAKWWLPDIYAGAEYQSRNGSVMNADGNFLDVASQNLWTGLGIDAAWDFKDKYLVQNQEWKSQAWAYKSQADKNQMMLTIVESYYDLLQAQVAKGVYYELAIESQRILDQIKIQIDQGLRYNSELLMGKSYLQKLKIEALNQSINYNESMSKIRSALSLDRDVTLVIIDSMMNPINMDIDLTIINVRANRPEFKEFEMKNKALESEMNMYSKGMWLPELKLNTNASMFGGIFDPFDPTGIVNLSLMWQIPYDQLVGKSDVDIIKAKIYANERMSDVVEDKINNELIKAQSDIDIAQQQIDMADKAMMYSKKALYQSVERQKLGTAQPLEVYQAQELNIKLKLQYLEAMTRYNKAQFALYVALGNEL